MEGWITAGVGIFCSLIGVFFGYRAFRRNEKTDITEETKAGAALLSDVGYIKSGIDDLKRKQEKTDDRHLEIITRLTAVEESAKQAHKRLDMFGVGRGENHDE